MNGIATLIGYVTMTICAVTVLARLWYEALHMIWARVRTSSDFIRAWQIHQKSKRRRENGGMVTGKDFEIIS